MEERIVYFITPYKSRDLAGNALVGHFLERNFGLKAVYLNGYNVYNKIRKFKPVAIVFDHMVWKFKAEQLKYAKSMGITTFVLPTEGLAWNEKGMVDRLGLTHGIDKYLDFQFSWGSIVQDVIKKNNLLCDTNCIVTGSPRFDFYSKSFSKLIESKDTFITKNNLKVGKPIILWATNTITAGSEYAVKSSRKKYSKNGNYSAQQVEELIQDQNLQYKDQMAVFEELILNNPDWNFVIKVHPAEQVAPYERLASQYPDRTFLIFNVPIFDVLVHADILFQRNCTTATEGWILNKPVLQTEYSSYPRKAQDEFLQCSDIVTDYPQTLDRIKFYLNGGKVPDQQLIHRERFIEKFYHKIDGLSHRRIAEVIGNAVMKITPEQLNQLKSNIADDTIKYELKQNRRPLNVVKDFLGVNRGFSFRFWLEKRPLDKTEGESEATLDEILNLYSKFDFLHSNINP